MASKKFFPAGFLFFPFIIISSLYLFIRFYQLDQKVSLKADQAIHLYEAKIMVDQQSPRLLGPMTSKSYAGRYFYTGANYYYVLAVFGILANWSPVYVAVQFILVDLFFFYLFFVWLKKKIGSEIPIILFTLVAVSPYLVAYSRSIWNPRLLIPLSVIALIALEKYLNCKKAVFLILAAFAWGFAFACHYSSVLWFIPFIFFLYKSGNIKKLSTWIYVGVGFIAGNLPLFVFEFRNSFYNLKTFMFVFANKGSGSFDSYYLVFSLLIFFLTATALILKKYLVYNFTKTLIVLIFIIISLIQFYRFGNYENVNPVLGWGYPEQNKVVSLILDHGCPENFNIANTTNPDTRSYDLRYLLYLHGCPPLGVGQYPGSEKLFVIAPTERNPRKDSVWEISSFGEFSIKRTIAINNHVNFYELDKNKSK